MLEIHITVPTTLKIIQSQNLIMKIGHWDEKLLNIFFQLMLKIFDYFILTKIDFENFMLWVATITYLFDPSKINLRPIGIQIYGNF